MTAPERIRVAQDADGFWTCREAVSGSQEYVRADLHTELAAENERLKREVADANADRDRWYESSFRATALSRTGAVKVDAAYLRETLAWVRRNMDEQPSQAKQQIDLALGSILSALEPAAPEGQQPVAEALTYGQKLIAEAIEHHFGERNEHYDEDVDDTTVHDAWEAFDALTCPSEQAVTGPWRPIKSAPKDASLILYANKFGEIGYCYWSKAGGPFDESMWWDDQADDECCPVVWLPADTLPPLKAAR